MESELGEGSPKKPETRGAGIPVRNPADPRTEKDFGIETLEPYVPTEVFKGNDCDIVYVEHLPLHYNYDVIYKEFCNYGQIKEIRVMLDKNSSWKSWISYFSCDDALISHSGIIKSGKFTSLLVKESPVDLAAYRPSIYQPTEKELDIFPVDERQPKPPKWLIATARTEKVNFMKLRRHIRQLVGGIRNSDITRFGRNSVLIHTLSETQSVQLKESRFDSDDMLKGIKPHYNFSYVKGVMFNEDLYDFSEEEILEMCPGNVWKVFKVPRSTMIIFTFVDDYLPTHVVIENINMPVRPYKPRPLQCFNCFGYGHASRVCTRNKICNICSEAEHGECSRQPLCVNCKKGHNARDKVCDYRNKELEAILKSQAEHISVGQAKRLLSRTVKYSDVVSSNLAEADKPRVHTGSKVQPYGKSDMKLNIDNKDITYYVPRKDGLSPSELEINKASQVVTTGITKASLDASQASDVEASQTSCDEVPQTVSLPELRSSPSQGLQIDVQHTALVHHSDMEVEGDSLRPKRIRTPSLSPPLSPGQSVHTSNKYELLRFADSQGKPVCAGIGATPKLPKIKKPKVPQSRPSLSRPLSSVSFKASRKAPKAS